MESVSLLWICSITTSCPTLCHPIDYSSPDSSAHGVLKVRILEWVAISFSRGSSQPWISCCCSVASNSLRPHGLQHARLPCPPLSPGVCSNSRPWSRWCRPTISHSVVPFSSCPQSFPASGMDSRLVFKRTATPEAGLSGPHRVLAAYIPALGEQTTIGKRGLKRAWGAHKEDVDTKSL